MSALEKPSLIERFVKLIPLPYSWAALAWTLILGFPGGALVGYLDFGSAIFTSTQANIFNSAALDVALFYLFYVVRYLRLRILRAEQHIVPILSGGEEEYGSAFRRLSNWQVVIMLALIFATLEILSLPLNASFSFGWNLAQYAVIALGLACFVWEYSMFNWGLHRLGRSQLRLKSFLEDRMMGAKPVGNAALSSTIAYFGAILFTFLLGTSNARINGPGLYGFIVVLLALGVVMFFLPLNSLHKKMLSEKTRYVRELNEKFWRMSREPQQSIGDGPVPRTSVEYIASQLSRLKEYEITEQKLARTPTWPFDVQVLAKLTTIVLSVTAVLLTRVITDYLVHI